MKYQNKQNNKTSVHDGISPIIITETEEKAQFNQLWNYLVPQYVRTKTTQGEIIRIAGKVNNEFIVNGGINWDENYRKMLRAFPKYLQLGNAFSKHDIDIAEGLINLLITAGNEGRIDDFLCAALCACAVAWIQQNPDVIAPIDVDYTR